MQILPVSPALWHRHYEDATHERSIETFGNKGHNLFTLNAAPGFYSMVPDFMVIPISTYPVNFDSVDLSQYERYAVRSSGPVSMPGQMDTFLNVAAKDVPDAVEKVRQSGVKAVSNTAVIIQAFIKGNFSGVAMTGTYDHFMPHIVLTEGTGEDLVSGKSSSNAFGKLSLGTKLKLFTILRRVHDTFGPSDVEFVSPYDEAIFLVQRRDLKSFDYFEHTEDIKINDATLLFQGKQLGAKVPFQSTRKSVKTVHHLDPKGYAKSRGAVMAINGSEVCHAAVIAKAKSKPIIQITAENKLLLDGWKYIITTPNGAVYGSNKKVKLPEVPKSASYYTERQWTPLNLHPQVEFISVCQMISYFYYNLRKPTYTAKDVADILATYTLYAIIGESRHSAHTDTLCNLLGIKDKLNFRKGVARSEALDLIDFNVFQNPQRVIEITEVITDLFNNTWWNRAYGGKKWGRIAQILLDFLHSTLSAAEFVDAIIHSAHNGNKLIHPDSVKFSMFSKSDKIDPNFNLLLDRKAVSFISFLELLLRVEQINKPSKTPINISKYLTRLDIDETIVTPQGTIELLQNVGTASTQVHNAQV